MTQSVNPLAKHFRQPAIHIKLPSQGQWWPDEAISLPMNGEIPVYPMTTRDEITLKTPDALLNGAGMVEVIQSCCPNITDAWQTPSIDVDTILISTRIATYGHEMEFETECPKCKEKHEYNIDLRVVLDNIQCPDYSVPVLAEGLTIKLRPQPYFNVNKSNQIEFEEQQIMRTITQDGVDEDVRKIEFNKHLKRLLDLNIESTAASIESITTPDGEVVSDHAFIVEFLTNSGRNVTAVIRAKLAEFVAIAAIKPVTVKCDTEDCGQEFPVALSFDYSSFFASAS